MKEHNLLVKEKDIRESLLVIFSFIETHKDIFRHPSMKVFHTSVVNKLMELAEKKTFPEAEYFLDVFLYQ